MTKKSEETKSKIRVAATKLFNEKGSTSVNTHDIAHEANLSPGNLYYHYRSKEEIIRGIYEEIPFLSKSAWEEVKDHHSFLSFFKKFMTSIATFEFFFRDFNVLRQNDQILEDQWRKDLANLGDTFKSVAKKWIEDKILKEFESEKEFNFFIKNFFVILFFGQSAFSLSKTESKRMLVSFLIPYHTPKGVKLLTEDY